MPADKSHLRDRKNTEKASVAQIVAQNNETLSKLITGERTKVGFSGLSANDVIQTEKSNSTWSTTSGEGSITGSMNHADAIRMNKLHDERKTTSEKSNIGVNDHYYDGEVPKMTLVPDENIHEAAKLGEQIKSEWKSAAIESFGNSRNSNDDNFNIVDLNLNDEILNTSNKDLKIASGVAFEEAQKEAKKNAEKLMQEMAEDNRKNMSIEQEEQLYLNQNNGLNYPEILAAKIVEEGGVVAGSYFETTKENITGNDADSLKEIEKLETGTFTLSDGSVVDAGGHDAIWHETLLQEKKTAKANAAKLQKEIDKELAEKEKLAKYHSDQMHAQTYGRNEDGSLAEPGTELSGLDRLEEEGFSQRLVEKLNEERAAKIASAKELAETTPLGESQSKRLKEAEARERLKSNASTTPLGQRFGLQEEEKLKRQKTQEEIELADRIGARSEEKNTVFQPTPGGPTQRGGAGKFRKLQAEKQQAKEMEVAKRVGDHMDRNQAPKVGKNMWPLQNDPYSFSTLSYPPDATNSKENGHFMLFYVNVQNKTKYEYSGWSDGKRVKVGDYIERPGYFKGGDVTNVPPSERGANRFITSVEASGTGANAGEVDYQRQIVKNGGPGNILYNNMAYLSKGRKPKSGINSRYQTTTRITDSVALYLPSGIGNTTSASYGDFQTGVAGYLAMSGLDIVSELRNRDFQGAAEKIFGVGGTLITEAAKKLATAGIETFTGSEGIQQSIDKAFGQTLNPYIEVAFSSTGMRTFDYTFKFAPKSKEETDEVQAIIQLFRFHMLPEMKSSAHRYLTLPSTFDIHYMWQSGIDERGYTSPMARENSFYNKIATCVLTNVDVNYTPNGQVQSFADGAPTQIDMSLSFKETEMMTKQHIQEGF